MPNVKIATQTTLTAINVLPDTTTSPSAGNVTVRSREFHRKYVSRIQEVASADQQEWQGLSVKLAKQITRTIRYVRRM